MGYPDGIYRVGPLARVNVAERMGTPRADEELDRFRGRVGRVAASSFHYHYARLIDTLHCIEKIEALLRGPDILSTHVRSRAEVNRNEGIGVSEAPSGTSLRQGRQARGADAQPGRGGHPLLRPVSQLLDARPGPDGPPDPTPWARRSGPGRPRPVMAAGGDGGGDEVGAAARREAGGTLVICYGNALRSDDGLGWHAAARLTQDPRLQGAQVLWQHQLTPELAVDVSNASLVVLVDASDGDEAGAISVRRLDPTPAAGSAWSHHLGPAELIDLARA